MVSRQVMARVGKKQGNRAMPLLLVPSLFQGNMPCLPLTPTPLPQGERGYLTPLPPRGGGAGGEGAREARCAYECDIARLPWGKKRNCCHSQLMCATM